MHNGLRLDDAPFQQRRDDALVFVGRVSPEKGVVDAIEIAQRVGRPLRILAKIGSMPLEQAYGRDVFRPALKAAGSSVEFVGEVDSRTRDRLIASSHATLMPGAWPEPFGLVAIESLACGTPVVARRVGALPEIVREGTDGFFGDDVPHLASLVDRVAGLDRSRIRRDVVDRFSASRMADGYESLMQAVVERTGGELVPRPEPLHPRVAHAGAETTPRVAHGGAETTPSGRASAEAAVAS